MNSGLEGTSQTSAAQDEKHRCSDHQNDGADEEDARVRNPGRREPDRCEWGVMKKEDSASPLFLQLLVLPVLAARHPDLSALSVRGWRPQRDPGCRGEQ